MSERLRIRPARRASDAAQDSDAVLLTLAAAGVPVAALDPAGIIVTANPNFADRLGQTVAAITGQPLGRVFGDRVDLRTAVERVANGVDTIGRSELEITADGSSRRIAVTIGSTVIDGELRLLAVLEDLLSARPAPVTPRSEGLANTDTLTGLPGRVAFDSLLLSSLRRAKRTESPFALLFCSIDGLDEINRDLGDRAADVVVGNIGHRLTHLLRHHDALGRLGANEFGVLAESVDDVDVARIVARRLVTAAQEPISVAGTEVRVSLSVGFTLAGGHERPTIVMAEADRALRTAESGTPLRAGHPAKIVAVTDLVSAESSDPT